ncbi:S-adenosyl-L-methionine-dependent methyltransferase [Aspergillus aurantiobrunneus]
MDTTSLISAISSAASTIKPQSINDAQRIQLISAVEQLRATLETPQEKIVKLGYGQFLLAVIRVAQGMGVFDAFAQDSSAITLSELSEKTKGDEKLLFRVMRFLCAHAVFEDHGPDIPVYKATPLGLSLANNTTSGHIFKHLQNFTPISAALPAYFASTNYQNPSDAHHGALQFALNTTDHYFEWLAKNPEAQAAFNTVMGFGRGISGSWFEMYPVVERLGHTSSDTERALIVDIGGNKGHELVAFHQRFPTLTGRLVLEDIPSVIDSITQPLGENIDVVAYNMFDPQPVQGARVYYMRTILLDWPDTQALEILSNIREAMAPDSVLLVHDLVYPERDGRGDKSTSAVLDVMMMECFSALERTESEWVGLLGSAGFRVVDVYRPLSQAYFDVAMFEAVVDA